MHTLPAFKTGKPRVEQGYVQPLDGIDIPFTIIEGKAPGPVLIVTAGVHASEFCSIEAAVRLQQTKPEDIKGTLVILPILNLQGFPKRSIYIMPEDGKNLNRQFPGRPDGTLSEKLAHWLVSAVFPHGDCYLDLHGGDLDESLMPFTIYPRRSEASKALAVAFDHLHLQANGIARFNFWDILAELFTLNCHQQSPSGGFHHRLFLGHFYFLLCAYAQPVVMQEQ